MEPLKTVTTSSHNDLSSLHTCLDSVIVTLELAAVTTRHQLVMLIPHQTLTAERVLILYSELLLFADSSQWPVEWASTVRLLVAPANER